MDKKLKIALGTDAFPPNVDGIVYTVMNYANYLQKMGCDVTVVTPENPSAGKDRYPFHVYRYQNLKIPNKDKYPIGWPFKKKFRIDIKNMHFDLLHSHCPLATSYFFRLVKRVQDVPVILTYHTKYEYDILERVHVRYLSEFAKRFLRNNIYAADEVWVPSRGTVDSLRKFGYAGNVVVMPNGVDMERGAAAQTQVDAVRRQYGLKPGVPTLIFVGRIMWYKNLQIVLDALHRLKNSGTAFQLLMIGGGKNCSQVKRYVRKIGLENEVIFTGIIHDRGKLKACYSAADLLVFPSTFDTNGLVVREAAACGVASLLVRGSCAAESIEDNETGFLCEESTESFEERLRTLLADPEQMRRVGENACEKIYLSWEDAVDNAYKRYEQVVEEYDRFRKTKKQR